MQALIHRAYGPPASLGLAEVALPALRRGEVRVRVVAAGVNAFDWHVATADPWPVRLVAGLRRPRRTLLGVDVAGVVEAVGPGETRLRPGEAVFADLSMPGGRGGGFAEAVVAPARPWALIPAGVTFAQAAGVPMAAVTALQAIRDAARVQPGQRVLVHGASGGVGTFAVQLARLAGAHVTAVCGAEKMAVAQALGADEVLDHGREDFAARGEAWDVALGVGGDRRLVDYLRALRPGGVYAMVGGSNRQIFEAVLRGGWWGWRLGRRVRAVTARPNRSDLEAVGAHLAAGRLRVVEDRRFALAQAPAAIEHVWAGRARGKVLVVVDGARVDEAVGGEA